VHALDEPVTEPEGNPAVARVKIELQFALFRGSGIFLEFGEDELGHFL
jgi:hypothetical protein